MDIRRQLNQARLEIGLTLEQIAMRTALSASILRHLDEGRFELLPPGLYARSYVRAFAMEVGLDPEATLARLEHLLPGAPNPLPALSAKEQSATKLSSGPMSHLSDSMSSLLGGWTMRPATRLTTDAGITHGLMQGVASPVETIGRFEGRRSGFPARSSSPQMSGGLVADLAEWLRSQAEPVNDTLSALRPATIAGSRSRTLVHCGAAAIDTSVLLVVDAFLVMLISWSSGIPPSTLLDEGGWAVAAFCAVPIALYFGLFGGIGGSTLGRYACSLVAPEPGHPLRLHEIVRRALVGR